MVAAVLLLWPGLGAPPLQAEGGDIRVVSNRQEVLFPSRVVFHLAAEAEAEIVEVRLHYRLLGSGVWAYGYPAFQPGRQINATFVLGTGGASYLPPGADLEHFYSIRSAGGATHQTPRGIFEYLDNRFQWERTRVGPLTLLHHTVPPAQVASVARELGPELDRLGRLLQIGLDRPIKGVIYNQPAEVSDAFPFQSRAIAEQQLFHGFAFPSLGVFVGLGLRPRIIVHESAHLMLHQALGPGVSRLPVWLDEGFASYAELGSWRSRGRGPDPQDLPLQAMSTMPGTSGAIRAFYQKAESVTAYLIEGYGVAAFQRFLAELRQGQTANEALLRTYGFDTDGLEQSWAAGASRHPAPSPAPPARPSLFMDPGTLIIGGAVLVALALFLGRYLTRRLRSLADRRVESSDGDAPG